MLWRAATSIRCMRSPEALNGRQRLSGKIGNEWCAGVRSGLSWQGTDMPQQRDRQACETWYLDPVDAPPAGSSYAADCSSGCSLCVYGQHPKTGKYRCMMGSVTYGCHAPSPPSHSPPPSSQQQLPRSPTPPSLSPTQSLPRNTCADCANILLLLTEDQDLLLSRGWSSLMPQTQRRLAARGVTMAQWRVNTPVCAPSRATLQSGRYLHNVENAQSITPASLAQFSNYTGGRGHLDLGGLVWPHHFAKVLRDQKGYVTGLFGKCMNGGCGEAYDTRGASLRRMGVFDRWFETLRSKTQTPTKWPIVFDSAAPECEWRDGEGFVGDCVTLTSAMTPGGGYSTSEIGNATCGWLNHLSASAASSGVRQPWLAFVAVESPKFGPAPWHWQGGQPIASSPCTAVTAPRLPSYNFTGPKLRAGVCKLSEPPPADPSSSPSSHLASLPSASTAAAAEPFHELVACQPPLTTSEERYVDWLARRRCTAMMAVDDMLGGILDAVEAAGERPRTYVLLTSDHGFTLGEHGLPREKGLLYEHNLRVPFILAGPGIRHASVSPFPGSHVDVAPTLLGLAGIDTPAFMDGSSLVSVVITNTKLANVPAQVRAHASRQRVPLGRECQSLMYYNQGPWTNQFVHVTRKYDDWSNTYIGLVCALGRGIGTVKLGLYDPHGKQSRFATPRSVELFNLTADPHEVRNVHEATRLRHPRLIDALITRVRAMQGCAGAACGRLLDTPLKIRPLAAPSQLIDSACRMPEALDGRRRLSGKIGNEWCAGSRTGLGWAGTDRPQLADRRVCHGWYVDPVDATPEGALQRQHAPVCSSGCAPCVYKKHPKTGTYRCMMESVVWYGCHASSSPRPVR